MYKSNPDFYKQNGIQKFGNWIQDVKKRPHQELSELCGAGWAGRLMKAFNREEIPVIMFSIFCTGGVDFVGGYTFSEFLKLNLFGDQVSQTAQQLGKLELNGNKLTTGEQVHEYLFTSGQIKAPAGWK